MQLPSESALRSGPVPTGPRLSAVVAVRDEEAMLPGCLRCLGFADEVIVALDDRTTDRSAEIAESAMAVVLPVHFTNFSDLKNAGLKKARGQWVLIVDADERVTRTLADEIGHALERTASAFRIPRKNYFFGQEMRAGAWERERPVRLFRRGEAEFVGDVHEQLRLANGANDVDTLSNPLIHFSHRSIAQSLRKTIIFGELQATELLRAGAPKVTWRTYFRVIGREFVRRMVLHRGYRDGTIGVIEAIYQPFSLFTVYVRLWELQRSPPLDVVYERLDQEAAGRANER